MFKNWLIGNLGDQQNHDYGIMHLIVVICVFAMLIIFFLLGKSKKISSKNKRKILIGVSIFQLVFEVSWRLIYLFVKGDSIIWWWPMYPCNFGGILLPIIALIDNKTMKKMFYLFGFVGACLTFAIANGIFSTSVFVFPILKSVLQHTGLLIIPLFEYASDTFKPSVKDFGWLVLGCLIHAFNAEVIDRWFGFTEDYMFFRSGLPFVIPGIPSFVTISVFGLLVFFILSYLLNIKESNDFFKNLKKKNNN